MSTPVSRGRGAVGATGDPFASRGLARSPLTREENGVEAVAGLHGTSTTPAGGVDSQSDAQVVNTPGEPLTGIRLVAKQLDEIIEFTSGRNNISKDLKQKLLVLRQSVQAVKREHGTLTRREVGSEKGAGPFSFLGGKAPTQEVIGTTPSVGEGGTAARSKRARQQSEGRSGNVKRRLTVTDSGTVESDRAPDRRERAPNQAKPRGKGNGAAQATKPKGDGSQPATTAQRTENPWQLVSRSKRRGEGPHLAWS